MRICADHRILARMKPRPNILLLAGSAEAREIAKTLQERGQGFHILVSEMPKSPSPMPKPFELLTRFDASVLATRMQDFDAVVDASHAFDDPLSRAGHDAAKLAGLPIIAFARDRWQVAESPLWSAAADVRAAMAMIGPDAQVFSATGWASLDDCATFRGARMFLRQTSPHNRKPPYPFVKLAFGEAPFSVASEIKLFRELRIDTLLCRNLGGLLSRPKLEAAKALGIKVILVDPPAPADGAQVLNDMAGIFRWIDAL